MPGHDQWKLVENFDAKNEIYSLAFSWDLVFKETSNLIDWQRAGLSIDSKIFLQNKGLALKYN